MAILQINQSLAKQMKQLGFFGDYILARRVQPIYVFFKYRFTFRWSRTPQGYYFWENIYDKFTN